jgi:hypothetical protein
LQAENPIAADVLRDCYVFHYRMNNKSGKGDKKAVSFYFKLILLKDNKKAVMINGGQVFIY